MPQVEANGLTLDYEEFGDASAPALLLIMGLGMPGAAAPSEMLKPAASAIAAAVAAATNETSPVPLAVTVALSPR